MPDNVIFYFLHAVLSVIALIAALASLIIAGMIAWATIRTVAQVLLQEALDGAPTVSKCLRPYSSFTMAGIVVAALSLVLGLMWH